MFLFDEPHNTKNKNMKQILVLLLFPVCFTAMAQTDSVISPVVPPGPNTKPPKVEEGNVGEKNSVLEPLLSYNFSGGNNNLSNLTPVIKYGWERKMNKKWTLAINPYAAGQIDVKDSTNMIPGLMLPGIAGLRINNFIEFPAGDDNGKIVWYPINLGLKLMTNYLDSSQVLVQSNIRTGIGYSLENYFQFGISYTYGWHNITSESESHFKNIFKRNKTNISYLTVVLETYLKKEVESPTLLFFEWRGLLNKDDFRLPNSKILTIGFRKQFSLDNLAPAAIPRL
jgi:hypothetical protein